MNTSNEDKLKAIQKLIEQEEDNKENKIALSWAYSNLKLLVKDIDFNCAPPDDAPEETKTLIRRRRALEARQRLRSSHTRRAAIKRKIENTEAAHDANMEQIGTKVTGHADQVSEDLICLADSGCLSEGAEAELRSRSRLLHARAHYDRHSTLRGILKATQEMLDGLDLSRGSDHLFSTKKGL